MVAGTTMTSAAAVPTASAVVSCRSIIWNLIVEELLQNIEQQEQGEGKAFFQTYLQN